MDEYKHIDDGVKDMWEGKHKDHLYQQHFVKDVIFDALFRKPQQSCRGIEGDINSWFIHMEMDWF